ncbi:MAG: MmcQ/YjbR family DNA-binding protein [Aeromicrobium sp.]
MADVPPELLDRVRSICLGLPETYEEPAWVGVRWRVRHRTFAHVFTLDHDSSPVLRGSWELEGEATIVTFRVPADELRALIEAGRPFHPAGWGRDVMGMHLDTTTDWDEAAEVLTDSYCLLAPQKLVARVDRPSDAND